MFGWLWGRRSAPPQREPLWKRVERCEESLARLERGEKERMEKDKSLKEEAKTQEMFQRAKSEVLKEVADKFGQIDPWAAATLSRLPKRSRSHNGDDDDASVEPVLKKDGLDAIAHLDRAATILKSNGCSAVSIMCALMALCLRWLIALGIGFALGALVAWTPDPVCAELALLRRPFSRQLWDRARGMVESAQLPISHLTQLVQSTWFFLGAGSPFIAAPIVLGQLVKCTSWARTLLRVAYGAARISCSMTAATTEPKTRGRGARVQHVAIDLEPLFASFVDKVPPRYKLTPGSLRGGGAATLAYYLQEVSAESVLPKLSAQGVRRAVASRLQDAEAKLDKLAEEDLSVDFLMRWSEQISAVGLKGMQTQRHSKELSERIEAALKTEATRYRNLAQAAYAEIAADREADESLKRAHEARKREEAREAKRKQELDEKIRREQEKALREKEKLVPLKLRMAGLRADTIEDKVKFGHLAEQKVAKALDLKGSQVRVTTPVFERKQDSITTTLGAMEAVAVSIALPSGEVVAELSVNPQKPVLQLKTQIAGLEGTPVGNQILLLNDKQVEDGDTLASFDITSSATFILLRRAPLLSGAINREELEHLLQDNLALQQAIDAYSNDLQYLPSDIAAISQQVVEGLTASGSVPEMPDGLDDQWQELLACSGKARQIAFSRALRVQLEKISSSLPGLSGPEPHPRDMRDHAHSVPVAAPTGQAGKKDPSCYTQRLQPESHPAPVHEGGEPTPEADAALRHVELPQRANKSTGPWRGAGQELKEFLHRQWSLCEGQDVGSFCSRVQLLGFASIPAHGRMDDTALTPGGLSPRFAALLEELAAVHLEEVARLRLEAGQTQPPRIPAPSSISPPVQAIGRCDSRIRDEELRATVSSGLGAVVGVESQGAQASASLRSMQSTQSVDLSGLQLESESDTSSDPHFDTGIDRVRAFFLSSTFEMLIAALLFVNVCFMAAQLQYLGLRIGHSIGYPRYDVAAEEAWPNSDQIFLVGDVSFASVFTIEMLTRMYYLRMTFWKYALNWVDFLVVCSSWLELFAAALLPISPTFLRLLRLGKLLRAIRVVRMSAVLESLQLLLKCISASVRILFWSLFLLMIIQISAGMTISYMVSEFMVDQNAPMEARFAVFRYYGSFSATLLTMFEVLFANWAPPCRILIDHVSEWYALVFIIYRCFVGFAVLNVVNAVFVQSTMKVAAADEEVMAREKRKAELAFQRKVSALFRQADISGDGKIDVKEFKRLLKAPKLQLWLSQLEIETTDLWGLFQMLDTGEGEISLEEFEAGTMRIKGMARSFDLAQVHRLVERLSLRIDEIARQLPPAPR
ncbi:Sodium channel protein type 10 subunit alpha [Symbiodinium microadriaticum]|uniref:Sodium channel protein type 10 subunit alpha n=1 Tax=Symbiodinium microadriaticum TaxID=2951 RepID=A0A1Q9CW94_SYMMI|nr:Sodium channel protein type 10 subunit alpha [Symbiodinium microadriaticum]